MNRSREEMLARTCEAAIAAMGGGVRRTETPDYAQLDSDCFMAMCVKPEEMMGLFDALPEIAAALRTLARENDRG